MNALRWARSNWRWGVFDQGIAMGVDCQRLDRSAAAPVRDECRSGEKGQGTDLIERPGESGGPGPSLGETQDDAPAAIDQATREGEDPGAHGARHGELIVGMDVTEETQSSG